jgi:AcrR family transcriptional regulator
VTRRVDETTRPDLLERIVEYALANGVASLSLRPLAKELGVSPGSLLYHFHSKEELTIAILKAVGDRQRAIFAAMHDGEVGPPDLGPNIWKIFGAPQMRPLFRLFFEVYGLALVDPGRFPGFFPAAVENWLGVLAGPLVQRGMSVSEARASATLGLATFRGLLLDACATNDDARIERAVEIWCASWT